jgi:hypothetical protein
MRPGLIVGVIAVAATLAVVGGPSAARDAGDSAAATCGQLNVTGKWTTVQSNVYRVTWSFTQSGTKITGTATLPPGDATRGGYTGRVGRVTGTLVGARLSVVVQWPPRTDGSVVRGKYVGTVVEAGAGRGRVGNGQAWDLANPSARASWTGTGAAHCGGESSEEPVRVDITFHADSLPTAPPQDGGQCPGSAKKAARILGHIEAQITPQGNHEGGGHDADTPKLSRCRVPVIDFRVDRVALNVIEPEHVLQVRLSVHIDAEGVHRPGQCKVGTTGIVVATYDDTSQAANSLRNDRLQIGPWNSPCDAHNHVITNNISSITADAAGSTWVRVWIRCTKPGTGYSPRNCDG